MEPASVQLTQGSDGNHEVTFSPNGRYFVDRWSRADLPPVTELRRSDSGALVCDLEHADAQAMLSAGWTMPERFAAKGRDGRTDIYGVIIKPSNFDLARKYPVLEEVYAGPHSAFVPKTFGRLPRQHALAELGFIVVQADGMGTNHRGKAFHDVAWKNLKDAGFPDRIAWMRSAAAARPWIDLDHVGIYGGSAGGQSAMRALIDHADFYKAAFADCGCHDNRMDKIWWNEQWLGWPVDDSYVRNSNVADAGKVQGALMLCFGEIDRNVDPASTMQVVNALEKANKDFELLIYDFGTQAMARPKRPMAAAAADYADFFVRHLLEVEPRHPCAILSVSRSTVPKLTFGLPDLSNAIEKRERGLPARARRHLADESSVRFCRIVPVAVHDGLGDGRMPSPTGDAAPLFSMAFARFSSAMANCERVR